MTNRCNIKFLVSFVLVILIGISCNSDTKNTQSRIALLPYYNEANFTPMWLDTELKEVEKLHKIPSFQLINQDGEDITEHSFKDKIYVTDFFFTSCPGICLRMTSNMSLIQEAFKDDDEVLLLSHSVTPETDSVPILKDYADSHGVISGKWHLVTGEEKVIYELGRKSYWVEEDLGLEKEWDEFLHTENFVLVDKNRHIRGIYNGLNKTSINQLIADIKTLKQEG